MVEVVFQVEFVDVEGRDEGGECGGQVRCAQEGEGEVGARGGGRRERGCLVWGSR